MAPIRPMDVHQRLSISASAIAAEMQDRVATTAQPPIQQEMRFNGGVAPQVANHYARILTAGGLPERARILDMGCGYGRIAMALARRLGPDVQYVGLDPNADGIDWARRNITPPHPNFRFQRIDVKSRPYNPQGSQDGRDFRFPFDAASLDLVFMISVLTHVDLATVTGYAREAARVLKPSGRLVTTIFLLDEQVENLLAAGRGRFAMRFRVGESRVENRGNPELAIAHPRQRVLEILTQAGFARTVVVDGHWSGRESVNPMDFQDLLIAGNSADLALPFLPAIALGQITPIQRAIYDRIIALTGADEARFDRFITWAGALAVNMLRWRNKGLTICEAGDDAAPIDGLRFHALAQLGITQNHPDAPMAYVALDDAAMVALLVASGRVSTASTILDALIEAVENGLRILDATKDSRAIALRSATGQAVPVTIPAL